MTTIRTVIVCAGPTTDLFWLNCMLASLGFSGDKNRVLLVWPNEEVGAAAKEGDLGVFNNVHMGALTSLPPVGDIEVLAGGPPGTMWHITKLCLKTFADKAPPTKWDTVNRLVTVFTYEHKSGGVTVLDRYWD